jgi:hypothetical protein
MLSDAPAEDVNVIGMGKRCAQVLRHGSRYSPAQDDTRVSLLKMPLTWLLLIRAAAVPRLEALDYVVRFIGGKPL